MKRYRSIRLTAAIVTVALLAACAPMLFRPVVRADVADNIARLSEWQRDFLRVVSSLSLKDAFDNRDENGNHVFASMTAGQSLYEGGWARYGISVIANNQFGIKAYSSWKGKVFDNKTYMVYDSYETLASIEGADYARHCNLWRAYDTWDESVADHSALFYNEKKYAKLLQAVDYKDAARKVVEAGYCSDNGYDRNLIKVIEDYGLDALDGVTPDEYGIVGMIMDRSRAVIGIGETIPLTASAYPDPVIPEPDESGSEPEETSETGESSNAGPDESSGDESGAEHGNESDGSSGEGPGQGGSSDPEPAVFVPTVVWASNAETVASVDENGNVTGHAQGIALITATYNGKEAACLVCVGTNAFVIDSDTALYSKADPDSDSLGKVSRGMPVSILEKTPFADADGTDYYYVRATTSKGKLLNGYLPIRRVYPLGREVTSMHMETVVHMKTGESREMTYQIYPVTAEDKTVRWSSSDKNVVTVTDSGVLTAEGKGNAVVTATASGGVTVRIIVNVDLEALTGISTTALKLRENPSLDSDYYGIIAGCTHMSVLKGPVDGWFYVQTELISNAVKYGYCLAQYVEVDGELPIGIEAQDPELPEVPIDPDEPGGTEGRKRSAYVSVDTILNVRDKPGTSGKIICRLPDRTEVVIIGEDVIVEKETKYKTWCLIRFDDPETDRETEGYACADFLVVTGELKDDDSGGTDAPTPPDDPNPPDDPTIQDPVTPYLSDDAFIWMVAPGTTADGFRIELGYMSVVIAGPDGVEKQDGDTLKTGDTAELYIGSVAVWKKTVAVMGDVTGDGAVNARDYMLVKRTALKTWELDPLQRRASSFIVPDRVGAQEYLIVKRMALGTYRFSNYPD